MAWDRRPAGLRRRAQPPPGVGPGGQGPAPADRAAVGRAGRGGRAGPRSRHRGPGPAGAHGRHGAGAPRRLRRGGRDLLRLGRPARRSGFLAWLDAAIEQERGLDAPTIETSLDAVQVLTVHAAKGLEWDCVAVRVGRGVVPGPRGRCGQLLEGRPLGGVRAQGQGLVRRARRCPLRAARRRRRAAAPALAGRPRLGGAGQGLRRVRARGWPARDRRGAATGLRRADPGPLRAAPHGAGVGRRRHPQGHLGVPRRARRRPRTGARAVGGDAGGRRGRTRGQPSPGRTGSPPVAGRPAGHPA